MSSYYEALPIYKTASDLVVLLDKIVRVFPRYHKYTIGSRMRDMAIACLSSDDVRGSADASWWPAARLRRET